jgi:hypothetical protein
MSENSLYSTEEVPSTPTPKLKAPKSEPAAKPTETALSRLRDVITKKVERPVVLLEVPERPGVHVRISPNITQNQMRNWRKQAGEDSRNGLDATKFACMVIGHTTVGIEIDGEEVFDDSGNEITFASSVLMEMTETTRPLPDCVRAFFGVDPHVEAAALAILDAAGFSDTVDAVDPTRGSSTN